MFAKKYKNIFNFAKSYRISEKIYSLREP